MTPPSMPGGDDWRRALLAAVEELASQLTELEEQLATARRAGEVWRVERPTTFVRAVRPVVATIRARLASAPDREAELAALVRAGIDSIEESLEEGLLPSFVQTDLAPEAKVPSEVWANVPRVVASALEAAIRLARALAERGDVNAPNVPPEQRGDDTGGLVVDLTRLPLEPHVSRGFQLATHAAGGAALRPLHLLEAAATAGASKSFDRIAELLALSRGDASEEKIDLRHVWFGDVLGDAYRVAMPFLDEVRSMWGRDFVTLALLADDGDLERAARRAGTSLQEVRDAWFLYVVDEPRGHRSRESWERWWTNAGVTIPEAPELGAAAGVDEPSKRSKKKATKKRAKGEDDTGAVEQVQEQQRADFGIHVDPSAIFLDTDAIPSAGRLGVFKPSEHDALDGKRQADIFASLIVAREVSPPFAIGLLGDWGVGKTFFMRLMQERVDALAGREVEPSERADTLVRTAQIEFNAWHYVDTDLWASLATRIFEGLSEELGRTSTDSVEEVRRKLQNEIRSSTEKKKEADAAIDLSKTARQEAATQLAKEKARREKVASEKDDLTLARVLGAVSSVQVEGEGQPTFGALRDKAVETAKSLGITTAIDNVSELERAIDALRDVARRGRGLAAALTATFSGAHAWQGYVGTVVLLGVVLAIPFGVQAIGSIADVSDARWDELRRFVASLVQLSALFGGVAAWVVRKLGKVSSALSYLEAIHGQLREPSVALATPSDAETALQEELDALDAEIAAGERKIAEADRRISAAQSEVQRINEGGLVYDFLDAWAKDARYSDRLGLISIIRKDFERLGEVLHDWARNNEADAATEWEKRPIERIVLYIDDLDRCPTNRVVEVLQAVHLLLAFDLFVVAVAVDARWLERSLNEAYNARRSDDADSENGNAPPRHRFSAHNYLEKIFQIPFTLPAMDRDGYRALVRTMSESPRRAERRGETTPTGTSEATRPAPRRAKEVTLGPKTLLEHQIDEKEAAREKREREAAAARAEEERKARAAAEAQRRIDAMVLTKHEQDTMAALDAFVRTPRLAKRLVNIYRLIRAHAATDADFERVVEREEGAYRAVLVLLAISVGRPDLAGALLDALCGRPAKYAAPSAGSLSSWLNSGGLPQPFGEILDGLSSVFVTLRELGAPAFDDDLAHYRDWAPLVGRYSFDWGAGRRVSERDEDDDEDEVRARGNRATPAVANGAARDEDPPDLAADRDVVK